ncbi:AAA family ATPase [Flavobacterium sp. 2]|uniref:AAA family ATPase n=1 Tax=Flavobacterium sp. 2 TaxID=308053 RepID=UPI000C1846DE|nr:AAA family ATPase [Flavobacterium sp. 2]PIF59998.1 AAA domain-containing protein [Flavobacterium sp. 2]
MHNNLFLNRLVIYTELDEVAYDETFHKGVNIIRGDNSSGKSTITHFVFFVLGGSFNDFVPEARKCSVVFAEVEMNGFVFTIKREIIKNKEGVINTQAPLYFFWGVMDESFNPPVDKVWQKFGYNTYESKKSFSNVMFENLGLPIVKGDANITFHQILRLLYIDQDSPTSSLFLYEHFDSQLTRETVSDLLLGVYNEKLYENKKRVIVAEKELVNIKTEIKATNHFFIDHLSLNPSHLLALIDNKEKEISAIQEEIILIRSKEKKLDYKKDSKLIFQQLNEEAINQRKKVNELEDEIAFLNSEIEDSNFFINTLKKKIKALKNSISTREFLGKLPLDSCPECLTEIRHNSDGQKCNLCKEPIDESFGVFQAQRMELEISFQINESEKLLELNRRTLLEIESKYVSELGKLQDIQKQVNASLEDVKSYSEEVVDDLNSRKGFIEGEILQYRTMLENAELYTKLIEKRQELEKEIKSLYFFIRKAEENQTKLKEEVNESIREEGIYLLNNDLDRQDEFKNANDFYIDFSNNLVYLKSKDTETAKIYHKFSASSNFYLKVAGRFAIFLASLRVEQMRFPRFIFADNMEDKGIEILRAQNLQKLLIDRVGQYNSNYYQMIYTTSYISEELNHSDLVVGEYYTKENPSLKNIPSDKELHLA